jgi:integrase
MPLTDVSIRAAKHGAKPIKLADERGLFLLLQPSGAKLWRLKFRINGKEKKLGLGQYPEVSLKDARRKRDDARSMIAAGRDPVEEKRQNALIAKIASNNTFELVAAEYLEKASREGREAVTIKKSNWLLSLLTPSIGRRPISEITPPELLAALKKVEAKGHLETARRMRSLSGRVFRYAIATSRAVADPSDKLRGALTVPVVAHHSAILDPRSVGQLLRAIDGYDGQPLTLLALQLSPHLFVRPGELRQAEWCEIDLEEATWTIPAAKMKMRHSYEVPLSRQAVELLKSARTLSAHQQYVFSSLYPATRPMSENTINAALRRLGYSGQEMTAHGFRATASTLLNESSLWNPDAIERALGHYDSNSVRGTYHRGPHWHERRRMAQWWSDSLDMMRNKSAGPIETTKVKDWWHPKPSAGGDKRESGDIKE